MYVLDLEPGNHLPESALAVEDVRGTLDLRNATVVERAAVLETDMCALSTDEGLPESLTDGIGIHRIGVSVPQGMGVRVYCYRRERICPSSTSPSMRILFAPMGPMYRRPIASSKRFVS